MNCLLCPRCSTTTAVVLIPGRTHMKVYTSKRTTEAHRPPQRRKSKISVRIYIDLRTDFRPEELKNCDRGAGNCLRREKTVYLWSLSLAEIGQKQLKATWYLVIILMLFIMNISDRQSRRIQMYLASVKPKTGTM